MFGDKSVDSELTLYIWTVVVNRCLPELIQRNQITWHNINTMCRIVIDINLCHCHSLIPLSLREKMSCNGPI
jgi:hypothetical protein